MKTITTNINKVLILPSLLILTGLFMPAGDAAATLTLKANHDHITIDSFYHGSSVSVRGECDPGADLIVKITSPEGETVLKEKGKAGGVLWMNVGDLHFENTPNLYFIHGTKKVEDLIDSAQANKYNLGLEALERHISIDEVDNASGKDKWFKEFVKYKEHANLYKEGSGEITFADKDGKHTYYMLFDWPYQAQPGDYKVEVFSVKNGQITETAESKVLVEQVGSVKYLSTMAKGNGAMYGIISIAVALLSGFGAGLIFKKGGGAH